MELTPKDCFHWSGEDHDLGEAEFFKGPPGWDFPCGPVVKTSAPNAGDRVQFLVRELELI